jgi:isoquinoline 1-oxidoreductase beta subunit
MPYAIANVLVEYASMNVDVPVGWWRSIGNSNNPYAVEAFFDEVARAAGKEPFEARRALVAHAPSHKRVLELAAEKIGRTAPPRAGVARGIAQGAPFGTHVAVAAEVSVEGRDVTVHKVVAAIAAVAW